MWIPLAFLALLSLTIVVTVTTAVRTRRTTARDRWLVKACWVLGLGVITLSSVGAICELVLTAGSVAAPGLSRADRARMLSNGYAEALFNVLPGLFVGVPALLIAHRRPSVPEPKPVLAPENERAAPGPDPLNNRELAHPRARELMREEFLWDCVDEEAPFGSDEGADSYAEFRRWRAENPSSPLTECLSWILEGKLTEYNPGLATDTGVAAAVASPETAFLAESYDVFTLDATILATGLAQLLDEGQIDTDAKPYLRVAIARQLHRRILTSPHRKKVLKAIERVVEAA